MMGSRFAALLIAAAAALLFLSAQPVMAAPNGSGDGSGEATAQVTPEATAKALFEAAEAAAAAGDRIGAAVRYEELFHRFPSVRQARIARLRSQQLRALQSEPEPDLRAAFDSAKANFAKHGAAASGAAIRALEPLAKSPALQQDLALWIAAEDARQGRPDDARKRYAALLDRETLTHGQASATVAGLLRTSTTFGDRSDARTRIHRTLAIRPDQFTPPTAARLYDEANDQLYALLALYAACTTLLLSCLYLALAFTRRTHPLPAGFWRPGLLFPLYAFAGAGLFAESWEHGRLLPFVGGGLAVTLLLLLQRIADTLHPPTAAMRPVTALLHVSAMLAALYLVFYGANLQHLMGL